MAVIGAFYYLRVIKLMYFDEPIDHHPIEAPMDMRIVLGFNALALLVVGIMPEKLMEICIYTITSSLS
jgi:NADH-quinone oxidoreductase subunit N